MKKPKFKRITVLVEISLPAEMTIEETDKWVEGCFPRSAKAVCHEQRLVQSSRGGMPFIDED